MEPKINMLLLFLLAALIFSISGTNCPEEWPRFGSSCYYFSDVELNWNQAFNRCIALDGYLVEIETSEENDFITTIIASSGYYYLIGCSDREKEGNWKWMTSGKILKYSSWRQGQPNNWYDGEDCGMFWKDPGEWNDVSCSTSLRYICEKTYKPIVRPEMRHTMLGDMEGILNPYLQFRCDPWSKKTNLYIIKWYVDNELIVEKGPSNVSDDLVLTVSEIARNDLGFYVQCEMLTVNASTNEIEFDAESNETMSLPFYAGFKISEYDITVNKGGYTTIEVIQTIPLGCQYTVNYSSGCSITLSLHDANLSENPCDAGIRVSADNGDMCAYVILAKSETDVWDSDIGYIFLISTIDKNYDDASEFDLRLELRNNFRYALWQDYAVGNFHVSVEETENYKAKMCYSHVDPHMRTCDGNYYENQKDGFFMLFHNKETGVEVQEATKYCFGNDSGPVCTCGIAVRAGKDVFMINRCGSINLLDFLRCEDGGIIQVERINDYKYKVKPQIFRGEIVTPTGTQIFANLLGGKHQNNMNIDIIISAKDFGKTEGLCGLCDGNRFNDFVLRNGTTSDNNYDYMFSNSWRLQDNENLFKTSTRDLKEWAVQNEVSCRCVEGICTAQPRRECGSTVKSITRTKCDLQNRRKRALGDYKHQKEIDRLYALMLTPRRIITKRSTVETNVTAEVANSTCSELIYSAPAVVIFPNKTAGEDLGELVKQCVYDVTESNDISWASVHVDAINTIVRNILELYPAYVANNIDEVENFLTQTCLDNCSGNGICLETGECNCTSFFKGPDCSFDTRVPVIIEDVEVGGVCDKATSSDCTCFTIRTDSIFDGFYCQISMTRTFSEGRHTIDLIKNATQQGLYEDIFTGVCCIPEETTNISREDTHYLDVYNISASNDGYNFGEPKYVYAFDSTCHDLYIDGINTYTSLKFGFCFVDGLCIDDGQQSASNSCLVCDARTDSFNWSHFNGCENETEEDNIIMYVAVAISVTGLILILIAVIVVWKWRLQKKPNVEPVTPDTSTDARQEPANSRVSPTQTVLWTVNKQASDIIPFELNKCDDLFPFDRTPFHGEESKHAMHSATPIMPPFLPSKDLENFHGNETRSLKGKEAKPFSATVIRVTALSDFDESK